MLAALAVLCLVSWLLSLVDIAQNGGSSTTSVYPVVAFLSSIILAFWVILA